MLSIKNVKYFISLTTSSIILHVPGDLGNKHRIDHWGIIHSVRDVGDWPPVFSCCCCCFLANVVEMLPSLSCLTFIFHSFTQLLCHFSNNLILISNIPIFFCLFFFVLSLHLQSQMLIYKFKLI